MIGTNQQNGPEKTLALLGANVNALTSSDETLNSPHVADTEASASRKACKHVWSRRWSRQVPATERLPRPFPQHSMRTPDRNLSRDAVEAKTGNVRGDAIEEVQEQKRRLQPHIAIVW